MNTRPIRVLLIEDHALMREGVRLILEGTPGIAVVGAVADGEEGTRAFACLHDDPGIDVVLTDLHLPGCDGLEVMRRVKALAPGVRVLFLSMHQGREHAGGILEAGADGYLLKQSAVEDLSAAIHAVARGETFLSPAIARQLMTLLRHNGQPARQPDRLTERERQVLVLLAEGETSKGMARSLSLSVNTIDNHRARILSKLGVGNTAAAIRLASSRGLLAVERR
jgi:DNA-binding NarL/FixJ family response regulator